MLNPKNSLKTKFQKKLKFLPNLNLILTIICYFIYSNHAFGQSPPPHIKLYATTIPSSCQANGEIHCTLTDTAHLNLEQIKYSYIPESGIDAIHNTTSPNAINLRPGRYKVIVHALFPTGLGQADAFLIIADSIEDVHVASQYTVPSCGIPYHLFTYSSPYGIVPSYSCTPTGKVQLNIQNGSLPYFIDIWKRNGNDSIFVRQDVFTTPENSGESPYYFNYRHYYTIDSLYAGDYIFHCQDNCGYHMPTVNANIPTLTPNQSAQQHLLKNSSGIPESFNIITFKEVFDTGIANTGNDDYYRYVNQWESTFEYRFINPSLHNTPDTLPWRPMPTSPNGYAYIFDTIPYADCYADLWFQNITLQTRPKYCPDDISSTTHTIYPQGNTQTFSELHASTNYITPAYRDYCGYHTGETELTSLLHRTAVYHFENSCSIPDSIGCQRHDGYSYSGYIQNISQGMLMHSYITFPIQAKITNLTSDSIVKNITLSDRDHPWFLNWPIERELHGDSICIEVSDAMGSPIYAYCFKYDISNETTHYPDRYDRQKWEPWFEETHLHCPDATHSIGLFQENGHISSVQINNEWAYTYYGDTIRLIESPNDNYYNFEATSSQTAKWNAIKSNPEHNFEISFFQYQKEFNSSARPGLKLTAPGLPNGRYLWEISYNCDLPKDTVVMDVRYTLVPEELEHPSFAFTPECTRLGIIPTAGELVLDGVPTTTYFDIRPGGVLTHSANAVLLNDSLFAGIPGEYTLSMYSLPENNPALLSLNPCYVWDTVIVWDGNPFKLDYLYAHVCNLHDESGNILSKATGGKEPYTYTLFSQPSGNGTMLSQNNIGNFYNVPCHFAQSLSVEMTDACNAHFISDITVTSMDLIRKGWAEDNQNEIVMQIGDTCHLYSLSMPEAAYHWTGPGGFHYEGQNTILPIEHEMQSGKYYVEIVGAGCGSMRDSILVLIQEHPCPDAIDCEGNHYHATRIDGLCWTTENLRATRYPDGRKIDNPYGYVSDSHPNQQANIQTFGRLYDLQQALYAEHMHIIDSEGHLQGICPTGWYLPSIDQYRQLASHGTIALRSPLFWISNAGDNSSGFNALPAGFYNGNTQRYECLLGEARFWASNSASAIENSQIFYMNYFCNHGETLTADRTNAYSIRCILAE